MKIPLDTLPGIPLLARGHAIGTPDVSRFLGVRASADSIAARAAEVLRAFRPRAGADASLAALASGERAAVLTGQQVGLLTGPLLTAVKALATVKVAEDLTTAGTPLAPVFWCASEDFAGLVAVNCNDTEGWVAAVSRRGRGGRRGRAARRTRRAVVEPVVGEIR